MSIVRPFERSANVVAELEHQIDEGDSAEIPTKRPHVSWAGTPPSRHSVLDFMGPDEITARTWKCESREHVPHLGQYLSTGFDHARATARLGDFSSQT